MKILALSTKLNQILYTYFVFPQKARNAKSKLSLVQELSFFDILSGYFLHFKPFGVPLIMYTNFGWI